MGIFYVDYGFRDEVGNKRSRPGKRKKVKISFIEVYFGSGKNFKSEKVLSLNKILWAERNYEDNSFFHKHKTILG